MLAYPYTSIPGNKQPHAKSSIIATIKESLLRLINTIKHNGTDLPEKIEPNILLIGNGCSSVRFYAFDQIYQAAKRKESIIVIDPEQALFPCLKENTNLCDDEDELCNGDKLLLSILKQRKYTIVQNNLKIPAEKNSCTILNEFKEKEFTYILSDIFQAAVQAQNDPMQKESHDSTRRLNLIVDVRALFEKNVTAPIEDLPSTLASNIEKDTNIFLIIPSIEGLIRLYPQDERYDGGWATILSSCQTHIHLPYRRNPPKEGIDATAAAFKQQVESKEGEGDFPFFTSYELHRIQKDFAIVCKAGEDPAIIKPKDHIPYSMMERKDAEWILQNL